MEDPRLKDLQEKNDKDNGISCRAFSDKQLGIISIASFWHRQFFEPELLRSCRACYIDCGKLWSAGRRPSTGTKSQDFYNAAQPCGAADKIYVVMEQWLMGPDHDRNLNAICMCEKVCEKDARKANVFGDCA